MGAISVRPKGGLSAPPPPVVPHPESLTAQAAYTEVLLPAQCPALDFGVRCFLITWASGRP
jgi:hypothetical protein